MGPRAAEGQTWLVDLLLRLYEGRVKPREAKEVSQRSLPRTLKKFFLLLNLNLPFYDDIALYDDI